MGWVEVEQEVDVVVVVQEVERVGVAVGWD